MAPTAVAMKGRDARCTQGALARAAHPADNLPQPWAAAGGSPSRASLRGPALHCWPAARAGLVGSPPRSAGKRPMQPS